MSVLLVTSDAHDGMFRDGEPGAAALDRALAERGVEARWVCWDDPGVDWDAASLVALRATWDYHERPAEFLAWTETLAPSRLLNGADVFRWNHHKSYLAELDGLPVVPTRAVAAGDPAALAGAVEEFGRAVVKPAVGAGGAGLVVVEHAADPRLAALAGDQVVQPVVESVRTVGEVSVFVVDGEPISQVAKLPAGGEVRVHEEYGGSSTPVPVGGGPAEVATAAYDWLTRRFGRRLDYLRVDLLHWQGAWVVSELELIEPGLYLDVEPGNAGPFADLVARRLGTLRQDGVPDTLD